jgi:hypothetical protein
MTDLQPGDRMIFLPESPGRFPWRGDIVTIDYCLGIRCADRELNHLYRIETSDKCHMIVVGTELELPPSPPFHPRRVSPPGNDRAAKSCWEGLRLIVESI